MLTRMADGLVKPAEDQLDPRVRENLRRSAHDVLLRCLAAASGADRVVLVANETEREPSVVAAWERSPRVDGRPPSADKIIKRSLASRKIEVEFDRAATVAPRAIAAPVLDVAHPVGTLAATFVAPPDIPLDRLRWVLESYARVAALSLRGDPMLPAVLGASDFDRLTGCLTYVRLIEVIETEIERSKRLGLELSCCFIDLDDFKQVNDERGHLVGNAVLRAVGKALRAAGRRYDSVGRFGGDEFVVVLPETDSSAALAVATRLESTIRKVIASETGLDMDVSLGFAEWRPELTAAELLDAADRSLSTAKAAVEPSHLAHASSRESSTK